MANNLVQGAGLIDTCCSQNPTSVPTPSQRNWLARSTSENVTTIHEGTNHFGSISQNRSMMKYLEANDSFKMPKLRQPYFVPKETENLQDEIMQLKIRNNDLKNEHKRVKTLNIMLEKELHRLENLVNQLRGTQSEQQNYVDRNVLVQRMRLKYKELKGRLYERERQFELARKNMKYTSMQELELELESYRAETVRLRKQIEELQRLNQKFLSDNRIVDANGVFVKVQEEILQNLIEDNQQMYSHISELQKVLQGNRQRMATLYREKVHLGNDVTKQHRSVHEKEAEIGSLRKRIEELEQSLHQAQVSARIVEKSPKVDQSDSRKLGEKEKEVEQLRRNLNQQQKKIVELEFKLKIGTPGYQTPQLAPKELSKSVEPKVARPPTRQRTPQHSQENKATLREVQLLEERLQSLTIQHDSGPEEKRRSQSEAIKQILQEQEQEIRVVVPVQVESQQPPPPPKSIETHYANDVRNTIQYQMQMKRLNMFAQYEHGEELVKQEELRMQQRWQKRLRKVSYMDVETIGLLLRYRLMHLGISSEAMTETHLPQQQQLTLRELEYLVQQKPFELTAEQAKLLARYLTEDNTDEYIYFNAAQPQEIEIVKSVLRKVVGKYEIFDPQETAQIRADTFEIIGKFKQSIIESIRMFNAAGRKGAPQPKGDLCYRSELQSAIKFCDLQLPQRCWELISLVGYQTNPSDVEKINYIETLDYFVP